MLQSCLLRKARRPGWFCNLSPRGLADLDGLITHVIWPINDIMKIPCEVSGQAIEQKSLSKLLTSARVMPVTYKSQSSFDPYVRLSKMHQGHKRIFRAISL